MLKALTMAAFLALHLKYNHLHPNLLGDAAKALQQSCRGKPPFPGQEPAACARLPVLSCLWWTWSSPAGTKG